MRDAVDSCFELLVKKAARPAEARAAPKGRLATQAETLDERTVAGNVSVLQVGKHALTTTNHGQQTALGVEVVLVLLHVLSQILDPLGQDCNLDLGRTGVAFRGCVFLDDGLLYSGFKCHVNS